MRPPGPKRRALKAPLTVELRLRPWPNPRMSLNSSPAAPGPPTDSRCPARVRRARQRVPLADHEDPRMPLLLGCRRGSGLGLRHGALPQRDTRDVRGDPTQALQNAALCEHMAGALPASQPAQVALRDHPACAPHSASRHALPPALPQAAMPPLPRPRRGRGGRAAGAGSAPASGAPRAAGSCACARPCSSRAAPRTGPRSPSRAASRPSGGGWPPSARACSCSSYPSPARAARAAGLSATPRPARARLRSAA